MILIKVNIHGTPKEYRTVWMSGSSVCMINQPKLPHSFEIIELKTHKDTVRAISEMTVRGAGAIGAAAAYAMAQAAIEAPENNFENYIKTAKHTINATRPTAYDLFYATKRVFSAIRSKNNIKSARKTALSEAQKIADENAKAGEMIGKHGQKLIKNNSRILTHCNAGWLAFVDWGSALAPIYAAKQSNKSIFVYVDETRPRCQGARLTAWELCNEGISHAIIADNASGYYMKKKEIDLVIVGADRIAQNGDVANKIGTYEKAVLAHENNIPFYVAAPTSTIDLSCKTGDNIEIEERSEDEVLSMFGWSDDLKKITKIRIAPGKSRAKNPSFDITPAKYITGLITEKGIIKPNKNEIKGLFAQPTHQTNR